MESFPSFRRTKMDSKKSIAGMSKKYAIIHSELAAANGTLKRGGPGGNATKSVGLITLPQLQALVQSVVHSKEEYDNKRQFTGDPSETMEQHLHTYLNKRYNEYKVVREWVHEIILAIKKYGDQDCEIAVFGKILSNRLSESFTSVQETLKSSVHKLLHGFVAHKNCHRSPAEIDAVMKARLARGVPFSEAESVVKYMYNEQDSSVVLRKVKAAVARWSSNSRAEPDSLRYRDLVQILKRFQADLTESFLEDFIGAFKDIDLDADGVIQNAEMKNLTQSMMMGFDSDIHAADATALSDAATQVMLIIEERERATYSECVDIFTDLISARWCILAPTRRKAVIQYVDA